MRRMRTLGTRLQGILVMRSAVAARRGSWLLRQSLDCLGCLPREPCFVVRTSYALFLYALPHSHPHPPTETLCFSFRWYCFFMFKFMYTMYPTTTSHLTHVFAILLGQLSIIHLDRTGNGRGLKTAHTIQICMLDRR